MAPRKHATLSIKEKVRILELIEKGKSYPKIASEFGIGRSTVGDIKKNKDKILQFVSSTERGPGKRKTLRQPENPLVEDALFTWFIQQRQLNVPISGEMICEKARYFTREITQSNSPFNASRGWLDNFKKRHGIRRLKIIGEKLSNDESSIEPFQHEFQKVLEEKNLTAEQIYNADESGLFWRVLPDQTLASVEEKTAPGRKVLKTRITFMPCANATGRHKLRLFVVGKAKKPRAFKSTTSLPVFYRGQKNAWVTKDLFLEWFNTQFIPSVRNHLRSVNLPERAVLLLDNCPAHPSAEELVSDDGNIFAIFLPPNTTALIQPMDQNVIQNIKLNYRKSLLVSILAKPCDGDNLMKTLKSINLKDVVLSLANCWESVSPMLIRKSWKNLHPQFDTKLADVDLGTDPEDDLSLAELLTRIRSDNQLISEEEAQKWASSGAEKDLQNKEFLTDEEIVQAVTSEQTNEDDDNDEVYDDTKKIPHSQAVGALNTALQWAEDYDLQSHEIMFLRRLRDQAYKMEVKNQTHKRITDFFEKK